MERPVYPELKIWSPIKTIRGWGEKILNFVGMSEPPLYKSDHYKAIQAPANLIAELVDPNQLQIDFESQPLGEAPVLPRMKPPENRWDSMGTY